MGIRKLVGTAALGLLLITMGSSAPATPIPGSTNELDNGNFENPAGDWGAWEHGTGLGLSPADPVHDWAAYCIRPVNLLLRQVVDETQNPLWNPSYHQKAIDVTADIRVAWAPTDPGHPNSSIKFRLDWWGEQYNNTPRAQLPTTPDAYSDWVTYQFTDNAAWRAVNPFNQDATVMQINGHPIQPRWVSLEIELSQEDAETVWVDNVVLTSKCVPEPASLLVVGWGVAGLVGYAIRRVRWA